MSDAKTARLTEFIAAQRKRLAEEAPKIDSNDELAQGEAYGKSSMLQTLAEEFGISLGD